MAVRKRGNRWQADVTLPDGKRRRVSFADEYSARRWELTAKEDIAKGRVPDTTPQVCPDRPSNGTANTNTLGYLFDLTVEKDWKDATSARHLMRNGRMVVEFFGRDALVTSITHDRIEEFRQHCADKMQNSDATINRKLAALSKMLHNGLDRDDCNLTKLPKIKRTKEKRGRLHYLSPEQEQVLLRYWRMLDDKLMEDLCIFLIDTGARIYVDAAALRWDAVGDDRVSFWASKGGSWRIVPTTKRVQEMLKRRREQDPLSEGPFYGIAPSNIRGKWDTMRQNLGWDWLVPHILRHTCATRLVTRGVDIRRVKDWLGHDDIKTTMVYAKLAPEALFDVVHVLEK